MHGSQSGDCWCDETVPRVDCRRFHGGRAGGGLQHTQFCCVLAELSQVQSAPCATAGLAYLVHPAELSLCSTAPVNFAEQTKHCTRGRGSGEGGQQSVTGALIAWTKAAWRLSAESSQSEGAGAGGVSSAPTGGSAGAAAAPVAPTSPASDGAFGAAPAAATASGLSTDVPAAAAVGAMVAGARGAVGLLALGRVHHTPAASSSDSDSDSSGTE